MTRLLRKRKVKRPWLLRSFASLLPFLLMTELVMAQDSDRDGLTDEVEQALGYDPDYFDSNFDGLNDFLDAFQNRRVDEKGNITDGPMSDTTVHETVSADRDNDGDGVDDFLETYGYYYDQDAHDFFGVRRQLSQTEWQAFKSLPHTVSPNPFELAGSAIENDNWLLWNEQNQHYELDFVRARASLLNAFTAAYGANDALTTGASNQNGSVSNIMKRLNEQPTIPPLTTSGDAIV